MDKHYFQLKHKLDEVFYLEPTNLGSTRLTFLYKSITAYLKTMPFIFILPLSIAVSMLIYILLGPLAVKLVSILQYGF